MGETRLEGSAPLSSKNPRANGTTEVLFLTPLPPPAGGIATWSRILQERGLPVGYAVRIVNTSVGHARKTFAHGGVLSEARRTFRILFATLRELASKRPALVHLNNAPGSSGLLRDAICVMMARAFRVPVVIQYRGLAVIDPSRRPYIALMRRVARMCEVNVVLDDRSAAFIRSLGGIRLEKLPNYFDERALPRVPPEPREDGRRPKAAFVGGLILAKGVREIVELAGRMPGVDFHMFGRRYRETDPLFDTAPANVIVHDEVAHDVVIRELRHSDLFLFPTQHPEGFPNVVCEAMAVGLPVVSTDVAAIPEMVKDGSGGRITSIDLDSLEQAVTYVLADEARRVDMGRYNQDRAYTTYSYRVVIEQLVTLYDSAL